MARLLFVQPGFGPPGGGNCVAAWMLEALSREHDVTTLSWRRVDAAETDRYFGTDLASRHFERLRVAWPWRVFAALMPGTSDYLRLSVLMREAKRRARRFDLVLTANNEADLATEGIQYVHYPACLFPRPPEDLRFYHLAPLLRFYYWFCGAISAYTREGIRRNLTLVNSDWVGGLMSELYGVETVTLSPPVHGRFAEVPWEEREESFVCIGRISPEKRLLEIVEIVRRLRERRPTLRLHILGSADNRAYAAQVRRAARAQPWIELREDLTREELVALLPRCRYGLHWMRQEHFGIAVAEMLRAGQIAFAHASGGPAEILAEPALLADDLDDACRKIERVLSDRQEQARLRRLLAVRADRYSVESFCREVRQVVARRLGSGAVPRAARA